MLPPLTQEFLFCAPPFIALWHKELLCEPDRPLDRVLVESLLLAQLRREESVEGLLLH